jgi:hypothetical protein
MTSTKSKKRKTIFCSNNLMQVRQMGHVGKISKKRKTSK